MPGNGRNGSGGANGKKPPKRPKYKKKPNGKNDTGAPRREITDEEYVKIERLRREGDAEYEIANKLEWSKDGFRKRKHADSRLRSALEKGENQLKSELRRTLLGHANAGNTACLIFAAKNILGWSDRQISEVYHGDIEPHEEEDAVELTIDEAMAVSEFLDPERRSEIARN